MTIELQCRSCKREFALSKPQETLYEVQRRKKQPVALECTLCGRAFMVTFAAEPKGTEHPQFRCPVSHCAGWVDHIEQGRRKAFWGCGSCGSQWFKIENLFREIEAMVKRHAYRRKCYIKRATGGWLPAPPERQPSNYETLVEREPFEDSQDFVRG
jgi:transcription elongation factor Elf1